VGGGGVLLGVNVGVGVGVVQGVPKFVTTMSGSIGPIEHAQMFVLLLPSRVDDTEFPPQSV
jgi:hypothetical protein